MSSPADAPQAGWFAAEDGPRTGRRPRTRGPARRRFEPELSDISALRRHFRVGSAPRQTGRAGLRTRLDFNTYVRIVSFVPKPSNRERILEAGLKVMIRKGYAGAGVRDIAAEARAPQGSFTNHFRSKEEFAREVLDLYFDGTEAPGRRGAWGPRPARPASA